MEYRVFSKIEKPVSLFGIGCMRLPVINKGNETVIIVYEELQKKYRPILRIDEETMLPVYDDTYRDVLQKILERFDKYEDEYYERR